MGKSYRIYRGVLPKIAFDSNLRSFIKPRWRRWLELFMAEEALQTPGALAEALVKDPKQNHDLVPRTQVSSWLAEKHAVHWSRAFEVGQRLAEWRLEKCSGWFTDRTAGLYPGGLVTLHAAGYFDRSAALIEVLLEHVDTFLFGIGSISTLWNLHAALDEVQPSASRAAAARRVVIQQGEILADSCTDPIARISSRQINVSEGIRALRRAWDICIEGGEGTLAAGVMRAAHAEGSSVYDAALIAWSVLLEKSRQRLRGYPTALLLWREQKACFEEYKEWREAAMPESTVFESSAQKEGAS